MSDKPLLVVIGGAPRTASTVLTNVVYGLLRPHHPVFFLTRHKGVNIPPKESIVKCHCFSDSQKKISAWKRGNSHRHLVFMTSVRVGKTGGIEASDKVIEISYDTLAQEDEAVVVRAIASKLQPHVNETLDIEAAIERLQKMNARCRQIQKRPFSFVDRFFHIHGSHRFRS